MNENLLARLFEHNNWANQHTLAACAALSDAQLDAEPPSSTKGTIRRTLLHLVHSQEGYVSYLTGINHRTNLDANHSFDALRESATRTGQALVELAHTDGFPQTNLRTRDNFQVEPWVLIVQIINHATEHREQINSMLTALNITPPHLDGWTYGEAQGALVPAES